MRLKSLLPALLPLALLGAGLSACDSRSTSLPTSVQESTPGGFAFRLDSATLASAKPYADSLRVELRQGTRLRVVAAALDSDVRVNDLESGSWAITVGLYAKDGALKYVGSDTVLVSAGKVAAANVTLRPAKGSVLITIRIDSTGIPDCPPIDTIGPVGYWYLQTVQGKPVVGRSIALILESDGSLSGTDGCNHIAGGWKTQSGSLSLSYAQTLMACESGSPTDNLPLALSRVRGWNRTPDQLTLLDSAGAVLATYGTRPMEECATPDGSAPLGKWLLQTVGTDTVFDRGFELTLDSVENFSTTDGCNRIGGIWSLEARTLRATMTTKMACFDNPVPELPGALWAARSWKLDTSGNDRHLLLLDSLGKTLAVYGTYILHPTGALIPKVDQVIQLDSTDTTSIPNQVSVSLVSLDNAANGDGYLLKVTLPHPGVKVHAIRLPQVFEPPVCESMVLDTVLQPGETTAPICYTAPHHPTHSFLIVGEDSPNRIVPQVLTTVTVHLRAFTSDPLNNVCGSISVSDSLGKNLSMMSMCLETPAD